MNHTAKVYKHTTPLHMWIGFMMIDLKTQDSVRSPSEGSLMPATPWSPTLFLPGAPLVVFTTVPTTSCCAGRILLQPRGALRASGRLCPIETCGLGKGLGGGVFHQSKEQDNLNEHKGARTQHAAASSPKRHQAKTYDRCWLQWPQGKKEEETTILKNRTI